MQHPNNHRIQASRKTPQPKSMGAVASMERRQRMADPAKRKILDEPESTRMLSNHFKELNSTAILLIRNPFKAIIGHRHLDEGGHTGHASPKSFVGRGKYFVTVRTRKVVF